MGGNFLSLLLTDAWVHVGGRDEYACKEESSYATPFGTQPQVVVCCYAKKSKLSPTCSTPIITEKTGVQKGWLAWEELH